jgi:cell division protein FtsL
MRVKTERLKMAKERTVNIRAISFIITMLIMAGSFVGAYHTLQYRVAQAEEQISESKTENNVCIKEIQKNISKLQIDMGKLETSISIVKDDNKYIKNRLDYIISELSKKPNTAN